MKPNLYSAKVADSIESRINKLDRHADPLWGKMDAAQMLAHCSEVLDVYTGRKPFGKMPRFAWLFKWAVRRVVIGKKPYSKNSPTLPQFKITESKSFDYEKGRLMEAIDYFRAQSKKKSESIKHPLFGRMSMKDRGWAMYKHLNHHLEQFGV